MEQTVATLSQENNVYNSVVKPVTITDVTLLAPGIWTGIDDEKSRYSPEGVRNGFLNTNWEGMNLFLDHKDAKGPAAAYWIGFIKNVKMVGEELHGDLEIWHPLFAMFVKTAKAKFGVSMTMNGREDFNTGADYSDFDIHSYKSGSLVDEPGCEVSWLPKMLGKGDKNSKTVVGGNVSLENIKELSKVAKELSSNNDIHSSEKNLGSNDSNISESSDSENHSDEEDNCKEVKKMTDEVNQEKSKEEQEEVTETKKTEDVKSESSTETTGNDDVKELSAKVAKLSADIASLTGIVQKSLAAGEESKEESKEDEDVKSEESKEEAKEETKDDELESTKSELEETKKELASAKAELDKPDEKSLAAGSNSDGNVDANAGMLGFLRKNAHLD